MPEHFIEFLKVATALRRSQNDDRKVYSFVDHDEMDISWSELYRYEHHGMSSRRETGSGRN